MWFGARTSAFSQSKSLDGFDKMRSFTVEERSEGHALFDYD